MQYKGRAFVGETPVRGADVDDELPSLPAARTAQTGPGTAMDGPGLQPQEVHEIQKNRHGLNPPRKISAPLSDCMLTANSTNHHLPQS